MWQQHFGAPYGSNLAPGESPTTPHPMMDHRADFRGKERSPKTPPPPVPPFRDHQKKAERGMALAFAGGLLVGLLLSKRM